MCQLYAGVKREGEFKVLLYAMSAYGGGGVRYVQIIINTRLIWQLPYPMGKSSKCSLNKRLGGQQNLWIQAVSSNM